MNARLGLLFVAFLLLPLVVSPSEARREEKAEKEAPGKGTSVAVMFGGTPERNLANTVEKNIPGDWSVEKKAPKKVKWNTQLGGLAYGGPIVAEGKVFVGTSNDKPRDPKIKGDRGVVMCFDEKTGNFLWQLVHDKLEEAIDTPRIGIASTPAIENGKLYYVANTCELVCATTDKGKILWSLDMIKTLGVYPGAVGGSLANCSPLIIDNLVIVSTSNGTEGPDGKVKAPKAPSLIAVDKEKGTVVWQCAAPGENILLGQWSSPTAAKIEGKWQVIYGFGDGWLRGLDAATGQILWKFDGNPKGAKFDPGKKDSKNYFVATPVVHDNKAYIAVGQSPDAGNGVGHLWCIDLTKKPTNKELDLSPVDNDFDPKSPKNKDSGLVWHHGGAILPKPAGNERIYHFGRTVSTVAIHDGIVYAAEFSGFLQALDAKTGAKLWEYDLNDTTWSSPYYVDGKVMIGVENGDFFVFEAGRTLKEPTKINMEHSVSTPPMAANGVLYISNGISLFAVK
jgi:outer membrane protein assembly factor BamB